MERWGSRNVGKWLEGHSKAFYVQGQMYLSKVKEELDY